MDHRNNFGMLSCNNTIATYFMCINYVRKMSGQTYPSCSCNFTKKINIFTKLYKNRKKMNRIIIWIVLAWHQWLKSLRIKSQNNLIYFTKYLSLRSHCRKFDCRIWHCWKFQFPVKCLESSLCQYFCISFRANDGYCIKHSFMNSSISF